MNEIFTFQKLFRAYLDCRENKRKTLNALKFEWNLERNLFQLLDELKQKTYKPGKSICFAVDKPTLREIFAATFRDRVIHHLLIIELLKLGERIFIYDSFACRKGKGTHKAVKRLKKFINIDSGLHRNDKGNLYYLHLDISGFFMSIDQNILYSILERLVLKQKRSEAWKHDLLWLAKTIIFSKPTSNFRTKGNLSLLAAIPARKSLFHAKVNQGLPIGNYSSQFFANLYLNELDQFIKRKLKCRYYVRYVDDLVLLSKDKNELLEWREAIETFLKESLNMKLNTAKTKIQPLENGLDFLGYFIKPRYTLVRREVVKRLKGKMATFNSLSLSLSQKDKFLATVNSYYGHFIHANSFRLRKDLFQNHLGKLKPGFHQKKDFTSLKIAKTHSDVIPAKAGIHSNYLYRLIGFFFCLAFFNFFLASKAYASTYYSTGTVVSTNLLWGQTVKTIDAFGYNASSIPTNTTLKVSFSQNGFTWKNSSGTVDGWDTLSQGDNTAQGSSINLSGLGWGGQYFYYKIQFDTTDTSATSVLDDVIVYYTPGVPAGTYYSTSTTTSTNVLTGLSVKTVDKFGYNISSLPTGTTLKVQFSQNGFTWKSSSGVTDGWDTLSSGDHLAEGDALNLSALSWGGGYLYYKIQADTTDTSVTPTLDDIQVYYTTGTPAGTYYPSSTITSTNLLSGLSVISIDEFEATLSAKPSGTTATVQFSQDGTNWYSSLGRLNQTTTLNSGSNDIVLKGLRWSGANFYYKIQFTTTDTSVTPILDSINLITNSFPLTAKAYWDMDEGQGTSSHDRTGNTKTLTLSAASWTKSGKAGGAWHGDGAKWLSRADDNDFDFAPTDDASISLWFKSNSASNPGAIEYLLAKGPATPAAGYAIYANTNGTVCFGIDDDTTWGPDDSACTTSDIYDATWHHLLAIKTGTTKIELYVDGVLSASDNSISATGTLANSASLYIGDKDGVNNGDEFNGDLDEIKIFRYVLPSTEIKVDLNKGAAQIWGALGNNTSAGSAQAASQEYCVPGDTASCTGPVGEWKMDDKVSGASKTIVDSSGNGNNLTTTNHTNCSIVGKYGGSCSFDGVDDYASATNPSSVIKPDTNITVEMWVKGSNLSTYNDPLTWTAPGGGRSTYAFKTRNSYGIFFEIGTMAGGQTASPDGGTGVWNGAWHHLAGTYDGSGVSLYVDGVFKGSTPQTGSIVYASNPNLYFGSKAGSTEFFKGRMDEVKVFDYVRTTSQIAWDYNKGKPVAYWDFDECTGSSLNDRSGNSRTGTITIGGNSQDTAGTCTDGVSTHAWYNGATGKRNYSLKLDGNDDFITTSAFSPLATAAQTTTKLSWGGWFYPTTAVANRYLIEKATNSTTAGEFHLYADSNSMPICGVFYSSAFHDSAAPTSTLSLATWNHILCTYDGTNINTYLNGKLIKQHAETTAITAVSSILYLGQPSTSPTLSNRFEGKMDEVKIWNYALSLTQVKSEVNGGAVSFEPVTGAPTP